MSRHGAIGEPVERVGGGGKAADPNPSEVNAFLRLTGRLKGSANDGILLRNYKLASVSLPKTPIYPSDKWKNLRLRTRTTKAVLRSPICALPARSLALRWDPHKIDVLWFVGMLPEQ